MSFNKISQRTGQMRKFRFKVGTIFLLIIIISLIFCKVVLPAICPECPPHKSSYDGSNSTDQLQQKINIVHLHSRDSSTALTAVFDPDKPSWKIVPVYFYSSGCEGCIRINSLIKRLSKKYPFLQIIKKDISLRENQEFRELLSILYDVPEEKRGIVPSLFIGKALVGEKEIKSNLEKEIKRLPALQSELNGSSVENLEGNPESSIIRRFESFSGTAVAFAGLVDGINPCAIAILLFFISYLVFSGRKGGDIWLIGILFTGGIFLSYFLIGLGLLKLLYVSKVTEIISKIIYPAMGSLALILGIYSLLDYLKARKGEFKNMTLQLPKKIKAMTHFLIAKQVRIRYFSLIAFFTGLLVSLLEFLCTGQVYLPTLVYVMGTVSYRAQAIFYLILYNTMFVLPLIVIFALVGLGTNWHSINAFFLRHISTAKLLASCLFLFLSIYMFITGTQILLATP